ncbi:MAG: hypothetical protein BGP06_00975 [Rhizobiales bacterium 65-9]|nr:stress-induced protein [Hyphomicrobiales bacterium]OJY37327.1 MAG: hypothetical protein BGP06_00975 [Rhizobiales bacterium 65-9]
MAANNDPRQQGHESHSRPDDQQSQHGGGQRQQNAGNFANDPQRASEAGKKGAAQTEQQRHQDASHNKQQK